MADLTFPTLAEIIERMQNDFQTQLANSNPFLDNSYIKSLIISLAGRFHENNISLNFLLTQLQPSSATGDFLDTWLATYKLQRQPATQSAGFVTSTGVIGTLVAAGELLQNSSGIQYSVQSDATVSAVSLSVTSLNRSGAIVTAVTATDHSFATGIDITIAGAVETEYNGTFTIIVTDSTTFTYTIVGTPTTPATGTITAAANTVVLDLKSVDFGSTTNSISGDQLTYLSVIAGIDNGVAFVQTDGLVGGTDAETDEEARARLLFRIQNPVAQFSVSAIENQCFLINGVTRVFVQPVTPGVGQVTTYFVRDNDPTSILPNAQEVTEVKDSILLIKPATINDSDVIVSAPSGVTVNFNFTFLDPNTSSMQTAIVNNLQQFFSEKAGVGDDILQLAYDSVIFNTIDPTNGNVVVNFTLSAPVGNVVVASNEIGLLGSVTFV